MAVKPVPEGMHTLTPNLIVHDAAQAIEFYKKALGAEEHLRMPGPGGKIMHAVLKVGDCVFFLNDEFPGMPGASGSPQSLKGASCTFYLYVDDCDASYQQALKAGARPVMPLTDMFWGDRYGAVQDPYGHIWGFATHKEDLTNSQIAERQKAQFSAGKP